MFLQASSAQSSPGLIVKDRGLWAPSPSHTSVQESRVVRDHLLKRGDVIQISRHSLSPSLLQALRCWLTHISRHSLGREFACLQQCLNPNALASGQLSIQESNAPQLVPNSESVASPDGNVP